MKNRIGLVSTATYPVGDVSTIRYSSYCHAMASVGVYVKIYVTTPNTLGIEHIGVVDGVHYEYLQHQRNNNKFLRYALGIMSIIKLPFKLKKDGIRTLIVYHGRGIEMKYYCLICNLIKIKVVADQTEYPHGYLQMSGLRKKIINNKFRLLSGVITISKELYNYHLRISKGKRDVFYLPMTISQNRYSKVYHDLQADAYIAVVFGVHNRDGLMITIKSYERYCKFALEKGEIPWKIFLIGDIDNISIKEEILTEVQKNKYKENIIFLGKQKIEDVPQLLYNAKCLLTTASSYISGGFPTKLGEYLLSGVPVVATRAGEIESHLTHNLNAFLANVDDVDDIASTILYVQRNLQEAHRVGAQGLLLASTEFNAATYVDDLLRFLKK